MKYNYKDNIVIIENPKNFSLKDTFDCGQCFRFNREENGSFSGIAFGKPVVFHEEKGRIIIENLTKEEFEEKWIDFLDLNRDYDEIKKSLVHDEVIKKAIEFGTGIRILKQEFFECVISFIISQQNNIPKIKKAVEGFARLFGEKKEYNGKEYYAFPTLEKVKNITTDDLKELKIGYRDSYIIDAIKKLSDEEISYEMLSEMSYEDAKKTLLTVRGIGNKVADCILLFSLLKFEAFPVDTWIKKAMQSLYNLNEKEIYDFSCINFGKYSGFAQQYIFYYIRSGMNNK